MGLRSMDRPYFADGAAGVRLVRPFLLRQVCGGLEGVEVDGLEDGSVQLLRLRGVEGQTQQDEGVGQPLDSQPNGAIAHVGAAGVLRRVEVDVDDAVQVAGRHTRDLRHSRRNSEPILPNPVAGYIGLAAPRGGSESRTGSHLPQLLEVEVAEGVVPAAAQLLLHRHTLQPVGRRHTIQSTHKPITNLESILRFSSVA